MIKRWGDYSDYMGDSSVLTNVLVRERLEDQSQRSDSESRGTEGKIGRCCMAGFEAGG